MRRCIFPGKDVIVYLKTTTTKLGRVSLSGVKGFRQDGKLRQKTVKIFGIVEGFKDAYDMKRVVVVADKDLNTSRNIALNVAKGRGFLFLQPIRGIKSRKELVDARNTSAF